MALAAHLHVDPAWLARHHEPILEPELPIVDPHHHMWDRPGWRYFFDDILADVTSGHDVRATIFVEARVMYRADGPPALRPLGETEFAVGASAMGASGAYGRCRIVEAIIGHADLRLGAAVEEVLEAQLAASGGRFRGIRHSTAWDADPEIANPELATSATLMQDSAFRAGFARLAPLGLSFDAWLYHPQLGALTALARAFPETTIVLDHLGGPLGIGRYRGRGEAAFAEWRSGIRDLAACPNVLVKLGGLAMRVSGSTFHEQPAPPSSETLAAAWKPYVETAIEAFGTGRCMFESNFPVDKGSCSYAVLWNAFKRLAAGCSAAERTALFSGNAIRTYRLRPITG